MRCERHDGVLCERRLLRTDALHGSMEQRNSESFPVLQARGPHDLTQRAGRSAGDQEEAPRVRDDPAFGSGLGLRVKGIQRFTAYVRHYPLYVSCWDADR